MTHPRPLRIGISGSYGGLNLGDEAILTVILRQLRESLPVELTVFSRNADDTRRRHRVEHAVPVRDLTRQEARAAVQGLDLLILGGGGILYDVEGDVYLREVMLAHELGVPVAVYAISAGPLTHRASRELVRDALNRAALVTVRDRHARRLLEDIGVQAEIQVTADPALLLAPEPLPEGAVQRESLDRERPLVAFSVREPGPAAPGIDVDHYHRLLANAADFMVYRLDANIVFIPMERQRMDSQHAHAVAGKMQCAPRASVLKGEYTPGQMLSLIGEFDFAVGMRLHFLIFAALRGVPFVALPYADKVAGLLQELTVEMPPLGDVDAGHLLATIDHSWDLRDDIRIRICERLPALQARAGETNQLLIEFLARQPPKES